MSAFSKLPLGLLSHARGKELWNLKDEGNFLTLMSIWLHTHIRAWKSTIYIQYLYPIYDIYIPLYVCIYLFSYSCFFPQQIGWVISSKLPSTVSWYLSSFHNRTLLYTTKCPSDEKTFQFLSLNLKITCIAIRIYFFLLKKKRCVFCPSRNTQQERHLLEFLKFSGKKLLIENVSPPARTFKCLSGIQRSEKSVCNYMTVQHNSDFQVDHHLRRCSSKKCSCYKHPGEIKFVFQNFTKKYSLTCPFGVDILCL